MPELHDLLERRAADYDPPSDLLVRVRERRQRRARNRRVGSALAGLLVIAVASGGVSRVLQRPDTILVDPPPNPVVGTWGSLDSDGSSQTMDIAAVDGVGYEMVLHDDGASVCAGAPATMTGTGQLDGAALVVPAPVLKCDDGSTPVPLDGSSLEEAVRDYTIVHDAATDTLTDSVGVTWWRPGAAPDPGTSEGAPVGGMWPQSSLDEVREAQEKADAGDPAYTWQVEPAIGDVGGDAEIFARFLTQELGWEGFRWGAESSHPGSMHWGGSDVDFVRCAAGEPNPLYPNDPDGRGCAPTLDEVRYETVRVTAYQPLVTGPRGIWVVQSSRPQPPFSQRVPPSDAEVAEAVEPFLRARVDGKGAEQHVDSDPTEIPLLYATGDGVPYDRFDHEVVEGPMWPFGTVHVGVRLFAGGGATVVEQPFRLERGLLEYDPGEPGTTENGARVGEPYNVLAGQVTFAVPTAFDSWQNLCCSTPSGQDLNGVQGYLGDFSNELVVVVDPLPPAGACGVGDQPVSADELVGSIRTHRNLSVTAEAAQVGGTDAVRLDVSSRDGASTCSQGLDAQDHSTPVLAPRPDQGDEPQWYGVTPDNRARLYVFDLPGDPARTVVIVIRGPASTFEQLLEGTRPIVDSIELRP